MRRGEIKEENLEALHTIMYILKAGRGTAANTCDFNGKPPCINLDRLVKMIIFSTL